ncbi:MAG: hypothetical protein C0412_17485, partial [Flavobacterium sp.]|nr:hypothetical protein [Flavobacterium sp.]
MHREIEIKNNGKKYINGYRIYWYNEYPEFWDLFNDFDKNIKIVGAGTGGGIVEDELLHLGFKNIEMMDIEDLRVFGELKLFPFHKVDFNFDKFPFNNNSVDLIVSTSVLEHLENQYHFIREVCRILKPGGKFIITLPNSWNFISRLLFL